MQQEQAIAQHAALLPVRDALADAIEVSPMPHYKNLLRGQLKQVNDWIEKVEPAMRGEFPPP